MWEMGGFEKWEMTGTNADEHKDTKGPRSAGTSVDQSEKQDHVHRSNKAVAGTLSVKSTEAKEERE